MKDEKEDDGPNPPMIIGKPISAESLAELYEWYKKQGRIEEFRAQFPRDR
jgi:hypothetical protein